MYIYIVCEFVYTLTLTQTQDTQTHSPKVPPAVQGSLQTFHSDGALMIF